MSMFHKKNKENTHPPEDLSNRKQRFRINKKSPDNSALLAEIAKTKLALDTAYSNFENVVDPDLIDCSIYEVNAIQQRYKYLLRQLKTNTCIKQPAP